MWRARLLLPVAVCVLCCASLTAQTAAKPAARAKSKPAGTAPGTTTLTSFDKDHTVTGWVDVIPFTSKVFHNTRMLRVWVPGNYFSPRNASRRYPVLYMQDGQSVFDEATSGGTGELHLDEAADHAIGSFKIHTMLMVGIDNAGEQRGNEYLPYPDPHNRALGAPDKQDIHGKDYERFLLTEVMPFIEKHYRVAKGAANTGIGGVSYGAVISLYVAMEHPAVFGHVLALSPTLWIGDRALLHDAEKARQLPLKIYLAVGTAEDADLKDAPPIIPPIQELEKILRKKGMGPARLKVVIADGGHHDNASWSKRLPEALEFLYGE